MKKRVWLIAGLCALALVLAGAAAILLWPQPEDTYKLSLALQGEREITLEYGESYTEPGATAQVQSDQAEPVPTEVTCIGTVGTELGRYRLKYMAQYGDRVTTAYRDVHIVDTTAPVIELVTNPDTFTFPNQAYQEEGFTATDSHDGDLTELVQRQEKDGIVTYTVTDSSGNAATVQRTIVYDDPIPPELALLGSSTITLTAGTKYSEPGYKATDNCDGDISGNVQVSGSVDIYKPGTYTLTYTVSDSYENQVSVSRKITVKAKPAASTKPSTPTTVTPNGKVIYLTFDDGPGPYTDELLDVLAKYNVKATFFVVNTAYISTVGRIAKEGHTVAIHSASHKFSQIYANEDAYFADLEKMQSVVESYTGQKSTIIRFPGGSSNTISANYSKGIMTRLTSAVKAQGFRYFDWNVDSNDAGGASSANEVFNNVVNGIGSKKTAIVLQHDIKKFSVDAVEKIINWGLSNGYTFLPLTMSSPECEHGIYN